MAQSDKGVCARRTVRRHESWSEKGEIMLPRPEDAAAGGAPGCCPTARSTSRLHPLSRRRPRSPDCLRGASSLSAGERWKATCAEGARRPSAAALISLQVLLFMRLPEHETADSERAARLEGMQRGSHLSSAEKDGIIALL